MWRTLGTVGVGTSAGVAAGVVSEAEASEVSSSGGMATGAAAAASCGWDPLRRHHHRRL